MSGSRRRGRRQCVRVMRVTVNPICDLPHSERRPPAAYAVQGERPMSETSSPPARRSRWYKQLYLWVLVGIAAGIALGAAAPGVATQMQPLGDSFVSLIKMVITPVVFVTVVTGIAGVSRLREVGRV